jgi:hypothetical protein
MATESLDRVYDQYLGRAPDAAGAQYWLEQLAGGAKFADVERAIATSAEAEKRASDAAKLAAASTKAAKYTPTFTEEQGKVTFEQPKKVTAGTVERILKDQLGIKPEGQYVPESVNPDGTIKYRFEGTAGKVPLADVYGIYASLPETFTSYNELADQIAYLRANPQQQLTGTPATISQGYSGSLALAMDESPTGEITREQQRALADPYYAMTTDAEGNRGRVMKDLMYLQPGSSPSLQLFNANNAAKQLEQFNTASGANTVRGAGTGITTGMDTGTQNTSITPYTNVPGGYDTTLARTYRPLTPLPFGDILDQTMQPLTTPFTMPNQRPLFSDPVNVPTKSPFDTTYPTPTPFTYPTQAQLPPMQYANPFEPAMFAEGGEVNQSGFMEVGQPGFMSQAMSGQMPTYQYPAYGGMPQDVFDFVAPRVSQGKLVLPPRQAPAQFVAPLYTAPAMPSFDTTVNTVTGSTGNDIFAPTPITPVNTVTGGTGNDIITTPVDYTPAITQAYSDILGRTPDAAGLSYWSNLANQGVSMDEIRRDIQLNENQLISQAYKDILGRDEVDAPGLAYWANSGQDMDTIRRNIQLNKEQQGIAALPVAQGPTTPVAETAPVVAPVAPVVEPPPPRQYFQTTNYESGEGWWRDVPTAAAGFEADPSSDGSWYNSGDSGGDVGANTGPDAAAAAAADAAAAAEGASGQAPGSGAEGTGNE